MKAFDKGSVTLFEAMKRLWAKALRRGWSWQVRACVHSTNTLPSQGAPLAICKPSRLCRREKPDLLAAATWWSQPSRVESFGLVLMEAWANEKPVIAADIDVSRHLVCESGGGVVVPFGDIERLAIELASLFG